jgi:hypothetical protein
MGHYQARVCEPVNYFMQRIPSAHYAGKECSARKIPA